ncbi:ParB/RepB/Spo0J family partition protein [Ligilactobacillus equi]|uniref:ParB/RepB/Spo0J family partition protein n=1 Tax=Ligilactobacillus equi TaxID=137357 RepID=UPI002ED17C06|nr:ParB/RepB/Spo0J family partition protein [Ligilactobacillus sp.]
MSEEVHKLALEDIRPNPYQPRKVFSSEALEELAQSIAQNGVFQPILVRKSQIFGYELIAGERRLRASELAGKTTIPAIIRSMDDQEMMEVAILENLQRENLSPLEEAQSYQELIERLNLTQEQLAQKLGKSRPYIANYLRLLGLPSKTKRLLHEGKLSYAQARTLLKVSDAQKIDHLAQEIVNRGLTVKQIDQVVKMPPDVKKKKSQSNSKIDSYQAEAVRILEEKLGTKVKLIPQKKGGKIEISYASVADFNRLLELLEGR